MSDSSNKHVPEAIGEESDSKSGEIPDEHVEIEQRIGDGPRSNGDGSLADFVRKDSDDDAQIPVKMMAEVGFETKRVFSQRSNDEPKSTKSSTQKFKIPIPHSPKQRLAEFFGESPGKPGIDTARERGSKPLQLDSESQDEVQGLSCMRSENKVVPQENVSDCSIIKRSSNTDSSVEIGEEEIAKLEKFNQIVKDKYNDSNLISKGVKFINMYQF